MEIHLSPVYKQNSNISASRKTNPNLSHDSFEFSGSKKSSDVSFGKSLFDMWLHRIERVSKYPEPKPEENVSEYAKELSKGILTMMERDIPPQNLKNIMTPAEFKELLPTLDTDNFLSSKKNIESGTYFVDLDYQSNFSRGKKSIFDILDEVSEYANQYHAQTGKDFVFALTDRDTLDGVRHAIRIIGENPDKFKHLKFLPAVKLSYAHEAPNSKLKYENSDMLVYGINPFSVNISNFIETTIAKRKTMIINFIKRVNALYPEFAYNVIEFAQQNKLRYKRDYTVSNLYWRAREYAETKGDTAIKGISLVPEAVVKEAADIINQLDQIYVGSTKDAFSSSGSQIITNAEVNKSIKGVFEEYSTHLDKSQGKVVSSAENLYDDMINCLSLESEKPVLALSAPFYLSHYFEKNPANGKYPNVVEFINDLKDKSDGMLCAFESVVPSYELDSNLTKDNYKELKEFNKYIKDNTKLDEVGGSFDKRQQLFV